VRVYNGGMDEYTAREVVIDYIKEVFSKPGRLDDIPVIEIPHTCEHCKFYDIAWEFCNNKDVEGLVTTFDNGKSYFKKDFGCIFWEGKE
jgi:hypothetical protein